MYFLGKPTVLLAGARNEAGDLVRRDADGLIRGCRGNTHGGGRAEATCANCVQKCEPFLRRETFSGKRVGICRARAPQRVSHAFLMWR